MSNSLNKDRLMRRSVAQALYRYLPGKWIDFYIKSSRTSYSAFVTNWNSEKIENANIARIKRAVWNVLESCIDFTKDYAPLYDDAAWNVMTPKSNNANSAIFAEISPLLFFCSNPKCRKIHSFKNSDDYIKNAKCKKCKSPLTQIRLIYYCECGYASPVTSRQCPNNCNSDIHLKSTFTHICSKCGTELELYKLCPDCGRMLFPRNALDTAQFYVKSFNLIDLVDIERERFITEDNDGCYLAIAYWLGLINRDRFNDIVKHGLYKVDKASEEEQIQERIAVLRKQLPNQPDDLLRSIAMSLLKEVESPTKDIDIAIEKAKSIICSNDRHYLLEIALSILEYDTVLNPDEIRTLREASDMAAEVNTVNTADEYQKVVDKYHFINVQASGRVPFVTAVYGYTRKHNNIGQEGTKICAFSRENNARSNIYATRMETEGVLFEVDRQAVMKWLIKNSIISSSEYSENMTELELKSWFINHCDKSQIPVYGDIDENTNPVLSSVYNLLHSISHSLIKQASVISGLDKTSLSEYIFCNIPAVFIYCQNSQGFNLGALFSAFEAQLPIWLETAFHETSQCIFDPVCIDEKGACSGCLYLNDISCCHFNQELDRRYIIGHNDVKSGDHYYGFWE